MYSQAQDMLVQHNFVLTDIDEDNSNGPRGENNGPKKNHSRISTSSPARQNAQHRVRTGRFPATHCNTLQHTAARIAAICLMCL